MTHETINLMISAGIVIFFMVAVTLAQKPRKQSRKHITYFRLQPRNRKGEYAAYRNSIDTMVRYCRPIKGFIKDGGKIVGILK